MRFFTHTVLSTLFVTGLAITPAGELLRIATSDLATLSATFNGVTEQPHLVGNSNRRDTSYRGSGRREILALPPAGLVTTA